MATCSGAHVERPPGSGSGYGSAFSTGSGSSPGTPSYRKTFAKLNYFVLTFLSWSVRVCVYGVYGAGSAQRWTVKKVIYFMVESYFGLFYGSSRSRKGEETLVPQSMLQCRPVVYFLAKNLGGNWFLF